MRYRRFGKTELTVSRLGMDCSVFATRDLDRGWDPFTYEGQIFAERTVHAALDVGINYFSTSPGDGDGYAESLLGRALQKRRHQVVLAANLPCKPESPGAIEERVIASLRRLRTNYIDILQIHGDKSGRQPTDKNPLDRLLETLGRFREKGIIGHFGFSSLDPQNLSGAFSAAQLQYDAADVGAAGLALSWCGEQDLGVSIVQAQGAMGNRRATDALKSNWSLLGQSDLFRLNFLLSDRRVHSINVDMRWEHEIHTNASLIESCASAFEPAEMEPMTANAHRACSRVTLSAHVGVPA